MFPMLRALPGRYALGTWWLSNIRCCGGVDVRNSQIGHVTSTSVVAESHFESPQGAPGALGDSFFSRKSKKKVALKRLPIV